MSEMETNEPKQKKWANDEKFDSYEKAAQHKKALINLGMECKIKRRPGGTFQVKVLENK